MSVSKRNVLQRPPPDRIAHPEILRLAGVTAEGRVTVLIEGVAVEARLALAESHLALLRAIETHREVLVSFAGGSLEKPVIVGIVRDTLDVDSDEDRAVEPALEVRATERIALVCGDASLELRADGSVQIRGTDVSSEACGENVVRGATVTLN